MAFLTVLNALMWLIRRALPILALFGFVAVLPDEFVTIEPGEQVYALLFIAGIVIDIARHFLPKNPDATKLVTKCLLLTLSLALLAPACATYRHDFLDGSDNSHSIVKANAFLSRRDKDETAAEYQWSADGSGKWATGSHTEATDATAAMPYIDAIIKSAAPVLQEILLRLLSPTLPAQPPTFLDPIAAEP